MEPIIFSLEPSFAAVFGASDDAPQTEDKAGNTGSHYGAFKRCNEDNARIYFQDNGISSIGLRPLTVYGTGRDFGVTSDPTKAMKQLGWKPEYDLGKMTADMLENLKGY